MPFTFSHPAIVLPLNYLPRKWVSLTGLIAGSMTPDFEYFMRMSVHSRYSHTVLGLFWFDVPIGLALTFLFHNLVRNALFTHLPQWLKVRFQPFISFNWNICFKASWVVVILSLLVGAASHIFWDSFTHPLGYFVINNRALRHSIPIAGFHVAVYKILQHGSTLAGAVVVYVAIWKMPAGLCTTASGGLRYWLMIAVISAAILLIRLSFGLSIKMFGDVIVTTISALMIALVLTPFLQPAPPVDKLPKPAR